MQSKWTSRKFLLAVASFLGSIGTSIAGLATDNKYVLTIGIVCSILSTGIYQVCESIIDVAHIDEVTDEISKDK